MATDNPEVKLPLFNRKIIWFYSKICWLPIFSKEKRILFSLSKSSSIKKKIYWVLSIFLFRFANYCFSTEKSFGFIAKSVGFRFFPKKKLIFFLILNITATKMVADKSVDYNFFIEISIGY